jgi:hypothetical protein
MKQFDAASRTLLRAAAEIERNQPSPELMKGYSHPLVYVWNAATSERNYCEASARLIQCNGTDLLDLDRDEKIDILVAAAFWEDQ